MSVNNSTTRATSPDAVTSFNAGFEATGNSFFFSAPNIPIAAASFIHFLPNDVFKAPINSIYSYIAPFFTTIFDAGLKSLATLYPSPPYLRHSLLEFLVMLNALVICSPPLPLSSNSS